MKNKVLLVLIFSICLFAISGFSFAQSNNSEIPTIENLAKINNIPISEVQKQADFQKSLADQVIKEGKMIYEESQIKIAQAKQNGQLEEKFPKEYGDQQNAIRFTSNSGITLGSVGDILVIMDGSSSLGDFGIGHAGIVHTDQIYTIESFSSDGVQRHDNDWGKKSLVYGMRVTDATFGNYEKATDFAIEQIGKPYNWNFLWKHDMSKFYCSQLVWQS